MITVYDKNCYPHAATNFVICSGASNNQILTQGKVYANLGQDKSNPDNIFIIDDRGFKQNFSKSRFTPFTSEKETWAIAKNDYTNLKQGKLYRVSDTLEGKRKAAGPDSTYVIDETGKWMIYPIRNFVTFEPTFSAQYQVYRMKKATHVELPDMRNNLKGLETISFVADNEQSDIKYVQVIFEPNGREYSYKWKGDVNVGDEAVVCVENETYPDLYRTKIVKVVGVKDYNPTRFDLNWLVNVVDMSTYWLRQDASAGIAQATLALQQRLAVIRPDEVKRILIENDEEAASLAQKIKVLKKII